MAGVINMATKGKSKAARKAACVRRKIDQGYSIEAAKYHCDPATKAKKARMTRYKSCISKCERARIHSQSKARR